MNGTESSDGKAKIFHTSEVNSLLDLQTEFLRKKKEAAVTRARNVNTSTNVLNRTKHNIFALSKAEKQEKLSKQETRISRIRRNEAALQMEEAERLKRQKIMEEKSSTYERLSKGEVLVQEDGNEAEFLVNFQLKKQELEEKMARETALKDTVDAVEERLEETPLVVHYDHTEEKGRVFGPSHISFINLSEEERIKKMSELSNLTAETARNRQKHKRVVDAQKAADRDRLNRIRARKGLPLLESSSSSSENEEEMANTGDTTISELDVCNIPLPSEASSTAIGDLENSKNETKFGIREWDRGKIGYTKWISAQRDERNMEFQPPSFYYNLK